MANEKGEKYPFPAKMTLRLIDANLNRCREGLRVAEDTCRFVLCSSGLYRKIRKIRHEADKAGRALYPALLISRNSAEDPGKKVPERKRGKLGHLLSANFKRAQESLRVLEEYSKLFPGGEDKKFKELRFKVYAVEKEAFSYEKDKALLHNDPQERHRVRRAG